MSAFSSKTHFFNNSVSVEPQLRLIFLPLGWAPITITSAPNSQNVSGATLYEAPLAQSKIILIFSRVLSLGKDLFAYSI